MQDGKARQTKGCAQHGAGEHGQAQEHP
jgi:hypothetical protein